MHFKQLRRKITYSDTFFSWISGLAKFVIKAYLSCLMIRIEYHPQLNELDRSKAVYAFWHGQLLLPVYVFQNWPVTIMTDLSWAGEILARILLRFGLQVVRGSSKRRGFHGIIHMRRKMDAGCGAALAVDGPRGPVYKSKPGAIYLAQKLNVPIIPLGFAANRYWKLEQTWDQFILPKPFSHCIVAMGEPIDPVLFQAEDTQKLDRILMDFTHSLQEYLTKKRPLFIDA